MGNAITNHIKGHKWEHIISEVRKKPEMAKIKLHHDTLPIHLACSYGAPLELIQVIHEAYPDGLKKKCKKEMLPLHYACWMIDRWDDLPLSLPNIRYLVEAYPDSIKAKNNKGCLPIHLACWAGIADEFQPQKLEVIKYLDEKYPEGVKTKADLDLLPIHCACYENSDVNVIKYLHEKYPEGVQMKETSHSFLPVSLAHLHEAPQEVMEYLIEVSPQVGEVLPEDKKEARRSFFGRNSYTQKFMYFEDYDRQVEV